MAALDAAGAASMWVASVWIQARHQWIQAISAGREGIQYHWIERIQQQSIEGIQWGMRVASRSIEPSIWGRSIQPVGAGRGR